MAEWASADTALTHLKERRLSHWDGYFGFYSSWLGGFFQEPWVMMVPIDDHGFHRGDGVFEAVRIHDGAYFDLDGHLKRLENSAQAIGLSFPFSLAETKNKCLELARLCGQRTAVLRVFLTRGPGSFSPNPFESVGSCLSLVLTRFNSPDERLFREGARAIVSTVMAKDPFWSRIKSLNYLPNVMMKKECVEMGYDLAVGVDQSGRVLEGATENFCIVSQAEELLIPKFEYTLRGTTMCVVMEIAERMRKAGHLSLKAVRECDFTISEIENAKEAAFVGTTIGVMPVRSLGSRSIGAGNPGPIFTSLNSQLEKSLNEDRVLRTTF